MRKTTFKKVIARAGYSGKPLVDKLGIKNGMSVFILSPPDNYFSLLGKLPDGVDLKKERKASLDFIQLFTKERSELQAAIPALANSLSPNGMLWISWPKGSSGMPTDLNENIIRDIGLPTGLVDIKVAAIDETWSGLKFVRRKTGK
jgi:hypothetical protein